MSIKNIDNWGDYMAVSGNNYIHEMDRKALEALKQIPGFTPLMKGFMKVFNERTFHILNMSGKVRLSETQYPHIYAMLPPICETLGIKEPELYLELDRTPNAYTYGDNDVFITITTGLLEYMNDDEIRTVLAHECGHIACHHVLYHTMGSFLLSGAASMLGLDGLFTTALQLGFSYWERCSEFSCDRAAAICAGSPDPVVDVMLRLAGGGKDLGLPVNRDEFITQATEYKQYIQDSTWNKVLEFMILKDQNHPLLSVRAYDIIEWCNGKDFQRIAGLIEGGAGAQTYCPNCQTEIEEDWMFCRRCGARLK